MEKYKVLLIFKHEWFFFQHLYLKLLCNWCIVYVIVPFTWLTQFLIFCHIQLLLLQIDRIHSHIDYQEFEKQQRQHIKLQFQQQNSVNLAMGGNKSSSDTTQARQRSSKGTNGMHKSASEQKFHKMSNNVAAEREERERIVLWRRPLTTLQYFVSESAVLASELITR